MRLDVHLSRTARGVGPSAAEFQSNQPPFAARGAQPPPRQTRSSGVRQALGTPHAILDTSSGVRPDVQHHLRFTRPPDSPGGASGYRRTPGQPAVLRGAVSAQSAAIYAGGRHDLPGRDRRYDPRRGTIGRVDVGQWPYGWPDRAADEYRHHHRREGDRHRPGADRAHNHGSPWFNHQTCCSRPCGSHRSGSKRAKRRHGSAPSLHACGAAGYRRGRVEQCRADRGRSTGSGPMACRAYAGYPAPTH